LAPGLRNVNPALGGAYDGRGGGDRLEIICGSDGFRRVLVKAFVETVTLIRS